MDEIFFKKQELTVFTVNDFKRKFLNKRVGITLNNTNDEFTEKYFEDKIINVFITTNGDIGTPFSLGLELNENELLILNIEEIKVKKTYANTVENDKGS